MTLYSEVENLSKAYEQMERTATKKVYDLKSLENQAMEAMTVVSARCRWCSLERKLTNNRLRAAESQSGTQVLCRVSEICRSFGSAASDHQDSRGAEGRAGQVPQGRG